MEPEDVVHVLRNMVDAVRPGGEILDLQVIPPDPRVEIGDVLVCEIDGHALFAQADAARGAVDALVAASVLVDEAVDDHDVRKHYSSGAELIEDFEGKDRDIPPGAIPFLEGVTTTVVVRERCRLRRLRKAAQPPPSRTGK